MEQHPQEFINERDQEPSFNFAKAIEEMTSEPAAEPETESKPKLTNKNAELPEIAKYLRPNERIVEHYTEDLKIPNEAPDVDEVLAKLTSAPSPEEIGLHGPSNASLGTESNKDNPDQGKFDVTFGRDSQLIAELMKDDYPELMRSTIKKLAMFQSTKDDPMADAEPGKTIHELRFPGDKIADKITAERGWKFPYYGSVDSTLMFISNLSLVALDDPAYLDEKINHFEGAEITLRQSLNQALEWAIANQDGGEYGLIEYRRRNPMGIENQILRDSPDSMTDKSGRIANFKRPVAALQAQANGYDAFANAADLYRQLGDEERAADLRRRAQHLHDQVLEKFWIEDERGGFFAIGLDRNEDGSLHQLDTRANDMAFALDSRLLETPEDRHIVEKLVKTLRSDEMRVGAGLRSLSNLEEQYLPGGYHTGSDWYVTDAIFAQGLERHGFDTEAYEVYEHIASVPDVTNCYPEYGLGNSDEPKINAEKVITSTSPVSDKEERNTRMQPPELMQGWTVAAVKRAQSALEELEEEPVAV